MQKNEAALLAITILSLIYIAVLKSQAQLLVSTEVMEALFTSGAVSSTAEAVAASIIAGYLVYLFIEVAPRRRRTYEQSKILLALSASIKNAFDTGNVFSHEANLPRTYLNIMADDVIDSFLAKSKESKKNKCLDYLRLKFAMETAHSRTTNFHHSLVIANDISEECSMRWFDVICAVDRLGQLYNDHVNLPDLSIDEASSLIHQKDDHVRFDIHSEMHDRYVQYIEYVQWWKATLPVSLRRESMRATTNSEV